MDQKKIKYFIYARKSTEGKGRQVLSIPGQLEDIKALVERENLTVIDTITEERSASIPFNRPAYAGMIARIKKGEASGIIIWSVDRLLRNPMEEGECKWLMQTEMIKSIWTPSREYRSEDNALLFSILASMATQYTRDLAERVHKGLHKKVEMGQPPGIAKQGYLNTKFATHGTNSIIEDPERWHIIRKGFDMLLSGKYNTPQITDILNKEYGFKTRPSGSRGSRPLHKSILYRIFTDPFYSGYFYYTGKLHKGTYKQMITVEEFDQVQFILGRKGKARPKKHQFAFTGFIKCGKCGCAVTASAKTKKIKATGEYKTYVFYHCTKRKGKCTDKHYTRVEDMENMIEKELSEYHLAPEFRAWALMMLKENHQEEIDKQNELIQEVDRNEQKVIRELDTILDLRIAGNITESKYLQKKTEKENQLIRIQEKKKAMETGTDNWLQRLEKQLKFSATALDRFKTRDISEQKLVCKNFGWNWTLKAQKLIIDKLEWFEAIKKFEFEVADSFGRLEPQKTFELYGEEASFQILRPIVRRLRDEVRTIPPDIPDTPRQNCA